MIRSVRAGSKSADGLDSDHVLLDKTLRNLNRLPAYGCSLVQRIRGSRRTELLDDMLQTAAGYFGHAVSILTEDERRVDVASACSAFTRIYHSIVSNRREFLAAYKCYSRGSGRSSI